MDEKPEEENVMRIEQISDVEYKKENIAFVIKPLHINQANRWARWCEDRGFSKFHNKAFALALDILENKTQIFTAQNNRLETLERLVYADDELLANVITDISEKKEEVVETEEERTRRREREKRAMMNASKKKEVKND